MPPLTRSTLRTLREAHLRNPLLPARASGPPSDPFHQASGGGVSSPRELLGIVRESLRELRDRFEEATAREASVPCDLQAAQPLCGYAEAEAGVEAEAGTGPSRSRRALQRQAERISALERYLAQEEEAFAALLAPPPPTPSSASGAGSVRGVLGSAARRDQRRDVPQEPATTGALPTSAPGSSQAADASAFITWLAAGASAASRATNAAAATSA